LDFVGSNFKERVIEFFLALSGILFYHLFLRPKDYLNSQKKKKGKPQNTIKNKRLTAEGAEDAENN